MLSEIDKFIEDNILLVYSVIHRFYPKGTKDFDQLVQDGRIAIWQAKLKHDPTKGKFSTIAHTRLCWMMFAHFRSKKKLDQMSFQEVDREIDESFDFSEILPPSLTEKERFALERLAQGCRKKEVYTELGIGQRSFKKLLTAAIDKVLEAENAT